MAKKFQFQQKFQGDQDIPLPEDKRETRWKRSVREVLQEQLGVLREDDDGLEIIPVEEAVTKSCERKETAKELGEAEAAKSMGENGRDANPAFVKSRKFMKPI